MGKENKGMIPVNIDGVNASVGKEKFTAVPSPHTWVCYYNPNGEITDDNHSMYSLSATHCDNKGMGKKPVTTS